MATRERECSFMLVFGALLVLQAIFSIIHQHWSLRKFKSPYEWHVASLKNSAAPILQVETSQFKKALQSTYSTEIQTSVEHVNNMVREMGRASVRKRPHRVSLRLGGETQDIADAAKREIKRLKIPSPVFLLSLPKSGTTSIHRYFTCGDRGFPSANHWAEFENGTRVRVGECMGQNVETGRPLLQGCGDYLVWTDTGTPNYKKGKCFYPSVHGLDNIATYYPNATIMLVVRNTTSWYKSASSWGNGDLFRRWKRNCQGFPKRGSSEKDWMEFYEDHTESIRRFVKEHPSLTYFEFSLESPNTARKLRERIGFPERCWKDCSPTNRNCTTPVISATLS